MAVDEIEARGEVAIKLRNVSKSYEMGSLAVTALDGVCLDIKRGEFVAIIGASGSGKSTLMNIIGCLDVPSEGEYELDGELVGGLSANRLAEIRSLKVGFVFQTHNLLPRMTALGNVELPMMYGQWRERRERAAAALEMVGLGDRMEHRPTELSGGQQQRVGIARALVKDPAILLADEPTGNLDSGSTQDVLEIIARLNRENGITAIIVTHEQDIASMTDRVITLHDGKVVSDEMQSERQLELEQMERSTLTQKRETILSWLIEGLCQRLNVGRRHI